jgi:phage protein U
MRIMLRMGPLKFSVDQAAYQSLSRSAEYRWARLPQIGRNDALQFTGLGPETVELSGVVFPFYKGGAGQIDRMRLTGSIGLPLPLIDGRGRVLGLWVIERVTEDQETFAAFGVPRKQSFSMRLSRYDGGIRSLLPF